MSKQQVKDMLLRYGVQLKNDQAYDSTYIASMALADYYGSSIEDEKHLALFIKDAIDDPDASDGTIFNRFYADACYNGIVINWEDML